MELYGSEEAPEYDLSRITAKIHILYGTNDRIASIQVSYFFLVILPYDLVNGINFFFLQCDFRIFLCWWINWDQVWLPYQNFRATIISILRTDEV